MNAIIPAFGCVTGGTPFPDALDRVLTLVEAPLAAEQVSLANAAGRILAEVVGARRDLPGFDQSAMDGYAVRCATLTVGAWLPVTGRTAAGEAPGIMADGGAHRILTGAPLPSGADAVLAQETVHRDGGLIRIMAVPPSGTNIRHQGEDMRHGEELARPGTRLDWRHITVLAAQGIAEVRVRRRPRVTLLSSGRELRGAGDCLSKGQIHDSNMPMLAALLTGWGVEVRPMPIVPDDAASMRRALQSAAADADIVLTTAGISVGDEDHVRDALHALGGDLAVLKVAMKPGKPLAAGRLGSAVFIGLPGNPLAALAGAIGFVRPMLARLAGTSEPPPLRARAAFDLPRKPGRAEFIPVTLRQSDTCLWADRSGPDGSGRVSPLLSATGFAFLSADDADVRRGRTLDVIPFLDPGISPVLR